MKSVNKFSVFLIFSLNLLGLSTLAQSVPEGFSYQAIILEKTSQKPLLETVSLTVQILSPDKTCLIYEEQHDKVNLAKTQGLFAIKVGSSVNSSLRTKRDSGLAMHKILSNEAKIVVPADKANCKSGYTAKAGDVRVIRTYVTHGNQYYQLQDQAIGSVPYATVADSIQGQTLVDLDTRYILRDSGVTGPKGDKGDKGDVGAKGDKGDKGDKGEVGAKGATGSTGPAGPAGATGPAGAKGANGAPGVAGANGSSVLSGINSPAASLGSNEDTYVNLTDGTVFQKKSGVWTAIAGVSLKGPKGETGEIKLPACQNGEILTVAAGAVKCVSTTSIVPSCADGQTLTMKNKVWTCTNVAVGIKNVLKTVKPVTVSKCLNSNKLETVVAACPSGQSLFSCWGSSGDVSEWDEGYKVDWDYAKNTCTLKIVMARCGDNRNQAGPDNVQNQIVTALCFPE